jgi:hypothetical protein
MIENKRIVYTVSATSQWHLHFNADLLQNDLSTQILVKQFVESNTCKTIC